MNYLTDEENRQLIIKQAKKEQATLKAMKLLVKADDDCVIKLTVGGLEHSFSSSQIFLPIIDHEIQEIHKAVKGKPNRWE